jgi:hypothetical protein
MSSLVNYLSSWVISTKNLETPINCPKIVQQEPENIIYLVSVSDLVGVKLKPVKNIIPAPARNMPHISKFELNMLNQAQLKSILSVKLKPIEKIQKPTFYLPNHPVLRELLTVRKIVY